MANDLTFQQLSNAAPANTIRVSNGSTPLPAGLYLDISALTGDSITALSNEGVIETVAKLLKSCQQAQVTANIGVTSPNRLAAFSTTNGIPIDDGAGNLLVTTTHTTAIRYPLDPDQPVGATN